MQQAGIAGANVGCLVRGSSPPPAGMSTRSSRRIASRRHQAIVDRGDDEASRQVGHQVNGSDGRCLACCPVLSNLGVHVASYESNLERWFVYGVSSLMAQRCIYPSSPYLTYE